MSVLSECAEQWLCDMAPGSPLTQRFDPRFVALSLLVAVAGAYTSLTITLHLKHVLSDSWYVAFVLGAGLALGYSTVWSMHFVGMRALQLETPDGAHQLDILFEPYLTVSSAIAAWLISALGLHLLAGRRVEDRALLDRIMVVRWLAASFLIAAGVCIMHYMGMRSQSGFFRMQYNGLIVAASAAVALLAASAGLLILLFFPDALWVRLLSSLVISLAVNGMHYTGMASATYTSSPRLESATLWRGEHSTPLDLSALAIAAASFLINQVLYSICTQYESVRKSPVPTPMRVPVSVSGSAPAPAPVPVLSAPLRTHVPRCARTSSSPSWRLSSGSACCARRPPSSPRPPTRGTRWFSSGSKTSERRASCEGSRSFATRGGCSTWTRSVRCDQTDATLHRIPPSHPHVPLPSSTCLYLPLPPSTSLHLPPPNPYLHLAPTFTWLLPLRT